MQAAQHIRRFAVMQTGDAIVDFLGIRDPLAGHPIDGKAGFTQAIAHGITVSARGFHDHFDRRGRRCHTRYQRARLARVQPFQRRRRLARFQPERGHKLLLGNIYRQNHSAAPDPPA